MMYIHLTQDQARKVAQYLSFGSPTSEEFVLEVELPVIKMTQRDTVVFKVDRLYPIPPKRKVT